MLLYHESRTGRPRRFPQLYPTQRACGKRGTSVMQEKTGLSEMVNTPCNPARGLLH
jgi:hypothetical protein